MVKHVAVDTAQIPTVAIGGTNCILENNCLLGAGIALCVSIDLSLLLSLLAHVSK